MNSVHYEGRGRRRDVEEGDQSSIMEKMDAKKSRKNSNSRMNAGPVPSDKVTPRKMLREALDAEERRVITAMLIKREKRYREMLSARESLMEIEKREAMVLIKEEEEDQVPEGEKKVEKEEIIKKRESEAIGEAVVEVVDVKDEEEKKAVDEKVVGGVSEKQEAESWVTMARDDWGWTWTCGEREDYWWEGVCYPYWEKMCGEHWVASKIGDEDQAIWKDDIWNLKHIKDQDPKP